jgi:hypothetical protein
MAALPAASIASFKLTSHWSLWLRGASWCAPFYVYRSTYTVLRDEFKHFRAWKRDFLSRSRKNRARPRIFDQFDAGRALC